MPKIIISRRPFDARRLHEWKRRRPRRFTRGGASQGLQNLLRRKARGRARKTRRFFGEAYVVGEASIREGYYSSFKWLTNRRFVGVGNFPKGPAQKRQEQLREALKRHFGQRRLARLQQAVGTLGRTCKRELRGKQPTAPDLWFVDRRGSHRFVEVKLPGDSVAPHQLAGMAAIACVLGGPKVSVEVIELHDDEQVFKRFCRTLKS